MKAFSGDHSICPSSTVHKGCIKACTGITASVQPQLTQKLSCCFLTPCQPVRLPQGVKRCMGACARNIMSFLQNSHRRFMGADTGNTRSDQSVRRCMRTSYAASLQQL